MKRTAISFLLFFSAVVLSAAQAPARVEPGVVLGTVLRAGTVEPLPNVVVSLEGAVSPEAMQSLLAGASSAGIVVSPPAGASLSETTQMMIASAAARGLPIQAQGIQNIVTRAVGTQTWPMVTTDADGRYEFREVRPGRYTVRAVREGFFGRPVNGAYPPTVWSDIVVAEKETKQAPLALVQGATIEGRVNDVSGNALPNATVQVFSVAYQTGFALLQPAIAGAAKTTDSRGEFQLFWIPPGDYFLGATPAVRAGGPGTPFQPGGRTFYPSETNLAAATPITIHGGEELRRMDISIRNAATFKIAGTVTNTIPIPPDPNGGTAAATVFFHLANRDLETPNDAPIANNAGNISLALASGPFEIPNVPPGSYEVLARVADSSVGTGLGAFSWGRALVEVTDRDVNNVAITVTPPANVRGTVKMADGTALPPNLRVSLTPMGGSTRVALYTLLTTRAGSVGADGSFTVQSVPPGRFRLNAVSGMPQDFYVSDVRQNATSVFDGGFDVDNRVPGPLEIVVSSGAGVIDGVVTDGTSMPYSGAIVALVPDSRRFENRALFAASASDASGRFVFRGIGPGEYRLYAWEATPPNAYQNANFVRRFEDKAKIVVVGTRTSTRVELSLIH
jgi:protocatechuate 3,4-dioxygenase beta subunit